MRTMFNGIPNRFRLKCRCLLDHFKRYEINSNLCFIQFHMPFIVNWIEEMANARRARHYLLIK